MSKYFALKKNEFTLLKFIFERGAVNNKCMSDSLPVYWRSRIRAVQGLAEKGYITFTADTSRKFCKAYLLELTEAGYILAEAFKKIDELMEKQNES